MASHPTPGLWDDLQKTYKTYAHQSFMADPPDEPFSEHWKAKGERLAKVYFGMTFIPMALHRIRNYFLRHQTPLLPYLCELISGAIWRVYIGRRVEIGEGFVIPHGYVVIDGNVRIGRDCTINPWVTIGLSGSRRWGFDTRGPILGDRVFVGTGARILGPITIGDGVRIGANAVVIDDVPAGATVVGVPGRVVQAQPPAWIRSDGEGAQ
jgi:serine O-acetyltransferase